MLKRILVIVPVLIAFFITGCMQTTGVQSDGQHGGTTAEPAVEPVRMSLMGTDFDDIEVPGELEISQDDSVIINTNTFSGGSVVYQGRVTIESLIKFFRTTLPKNGWEFVVTSYAKKATVLSFVKPSKNCIIYIQAPGDWQRTTRVQIWVGNSFPKGAVTEQGIKHRYEPAIRVK
ncbi:MAG: hypothetical protein H7844_06780 [Nitrospirae bacterium YQR-1]